MNNREQHFDNVSNKIIEFLNKSFVNIDNNLSSLSIFLTDKVKSTENRKLEKFESWFFKMKEIRKELEIKKEALKDKRYKNKDNKEEILMKLELLKKEIKKKQQEYLERCEAKRKEKALKYEEIKQNYIVRFTNVEYNKERINDNHNQFRLTTIGNQFDLVQRQNNKEFNLTNFRRTMTAESLNNHFQMKTEYNKFLTKLNKSKEKSIIRLNQDQRKQIYLKLKREEKERKKKEEEEKLKQMGLL